MKMNTHIFLIAALLWLPFSSSAQRNVRDSIIGTPWISVNYGLNWTAGDLADRHGLLNHVGMLFGYKTNKNWVFALDGAFIFGNQVKETGLFDALVDSKGNITDINGDIAKVRVLSRGYYADLNVGKIFSVLSPNKNSGIYVSMGVGFVSHNYRIETQDNVIPELELDYRKGYDRLTTGLNTQQFLGYAFMANQGIFNFYGGFYIQEGYTYNRRTVFFDQPDTPVSTDMRLDVQYGFKVAWLIPVYRRMPKEYYFN